MTTTRKRRKPKIERKIEIVGAEKPKPKPVKVNTFRPLPSFDVWWSTVRYKKGLKEELKEIIKKHFEARGFMKSKKFDEGLKDFGIET